jgi:hypothetical protein
MADTTAAAALLTGMLSTTLDPLELADRLREAPIFEITRGKHAPLDLTATIRYRILSSGRIVVAPPSTSECCGRAAALPSRRGRHGRRTPGWARRR